MLYLTTTLQIMGFWARYYMPYSAFLIIVALLILDRRQHERELGRPAGRMPVFARVLLVMVCACLSLGLVPRRWVSGLDDVSEGKLLKYNAPEVSTNVSTALPLIPVDVLFENVTDRLVALLPNGSTVAASEVGYLGAAVPKVRILDLVGLNDTTITKHGFQMDSVLAQQPDVIWMPHPDYTQQRGVMLSNPHFLEAYDFYPGAANFGLAVRRSGPHHAQVEQAFEHFWREEYPNEKMEDHLARAVRWDGGYQVLHSN